LCVAFLPRCRYSGGFKSIEKFLEDEFLLPTHQRKVCDPDSDWIGCCWDKGEEKKDLNIATEIVIPMILGLLMIFSSLVWQNEAGNSKLPKIFPALNLYQVIYAVLSFLGAVILQMGADAISKLMQQKMGKDRWNVEEESFAQNQELVETDTSINIPYLFRYSKKINKGWVNINPFRGTMVIGTPGSGKSFGIINPAIRQMIAKGSACVFTISSFPIWRRLPTTIIC
jgi:hypothetical protein